MDIKNVEDLRAHALQLLEKLEKKKIDITEATATAKIYESILSTAKTQMMYAQMNNETVRIDFLDNGKHRIIEHSPNVKLLKGGKK